MVCKSHGLDREEGEEKASGTWSNSNAQPKLKGHIGLTWLQKAFSTADRVGGAL